MDEVVKRTTAMGVMDGGNGCGLVGRVLASSNEKKKKTNIFKKSKMKQSFTKFKPY